MQKIRPDMDIGKNIQSLRYKNNLTQDQVIAKLNLMGIVISKSTYAKLETFLLSILTIQYSPTTYTYFFIICAYSTYILFHINCIHSIYRLSCYTSLLHPGSKVTLKMPT